MKKVIIVVLSAALVLGISCKKKAKEEAKTAAAQPSAGSGAPPPVREGRVIQPDKLWDYELQRLTLFRNNRAELLAALKSAKTQDQALMDKINQLGRALAVDFRALTQKLDINENDSRKTIEDPAAKKALDDYLNKNAELSAKLKQVREEYVKNEDAIRKEGIRLGLIKENQPGAK